MDRELLSGHQLPSAGLKRGTVALRPYDAAWVKIAHEEIATIGDALQGVVVDVQHVGSTAVPGLPSKPIIDIAVAVPPRSDADALGDRLTRAGLVFRGTRGRRVACCSSEPTSTRFEASTSTSCRPTRLSGRTTCGSATCFAEI